MAKDYDIIIVGSGPAGFSCAMQSSKLDKKVLVVESHEKYLGGTWINTGTVPSKALREAAKTILDFYTQFDDQNSQKPYERFRMADLLEHKDEILEKENKKIKKDLINNEVDVVRGFGRLLDKNTVEVETHLGERQQYSADYILICTGSHATDPKNFEIDHKKIRNYKSILDIAHIPRRLVIVGSGVNALEYATTFSALGTRVTVLNHLDDYLTFLDHEIKEHFKKSLQNKGITVLNSIEIESVVYNPLHTFTEVRFRNKTGDTRLQVIETEHVLHLGERLPNTENIGLENTDVQTDEKGFIKVDENFKTHTDSIYATGDVIGFPRLASASFTQGGVAACNMFGVGTGTQPGQIPFGIYTIPELSHIGLTEKEALDQGLDITVGRAFFNEISKADMTKNSEGLLKLVFDTKTFKLLGVHILGDQATNLVHLGQTVMAHDGDIRYFIRNIMNYPTLSEAYRTAAFNGVNRVYKAGVKYKKILDKQEKG